MRRTVAEDGQVLPLVAVLMVAVGLACLALGRAGGAAVARAQAVTAADAAALAGAASGREAASAAAQWNGARLVSFEKLGSDARARVELGGARAVARARRSHVVPPTLGGASQQGLAPALQAALARAQALLGTVVPITSGYRSPARQAALYANRHNNPYPVAPPGTSRHELGLAVDVPLSFVPRLRSVAAQVGLCHPYPVSDPIHFELCARRLP